MYYPQSLPIFDEVKKAKQILVNVHKNPDLDAVGSATAVYEVLQQIGKQTTIISPSDVGTSFKFLKHAEKIQTIDFSTFDFSPYDLLLILDSSSYDRVTGDKKIELPDKLKTIVIDHHKTNTFQFPLQIVDEEASANTEIVYKLFSDWQTRLPNGQLSLNPDIATAIFSGIAGDTVFFKYPKDPKKIFSLASKLLEDGADEKKMVESFYDSNEFIFTKLLGKFLSEMKLEKTEGKSFVWAAIPYEEYLKYGASDGAREATADSFFRSIKGTDFGVAMLEAKKGRLSVSFRSKESTDVSVFAQKLGGGGHKNAAGATVYKDFDEAVKTVLAVLR